MSDTGSQVLKQASVPVAASIYRVLTGFTTSAQESSEDVQAHGHEEWALAGAPCQPRLRSD